MFDIKENPNEVVVKVNGNLHLIEASVSGITLQFTEHAWLRLCHRRVPLQGVLLALETDPIFDHGDLVYCLTDRFLMARRLSHLAERLRGLTVVVTRDGVIKTVKWDFQKKRKGLLRRRSWASGIPRSFKYRCR